jgi:hypothetical protein
MKNKLMEEIDRLTQSQKEEISKEEQEILERFSKSNNGNKNTGPEKDKDRK